MAGSEIPEGMTDLFGLPMTPERGRGRPPHVWTQENSNLVNLLFACGKQVIEVARVLGITKPTFYKHYFNEIAQAGYAPLRMKGLQLARLNKQAQEGNVAAEKALAAMIEREHIRSLGERLPEQRRKEKQTKPLGKKEQAQADAHATQGRFGARPAPQQLMN